MIGTVLYSFIPFLFIHARCEVRPGGAARRMLQFTPRGVKQAVPVHSVQVITSILYCNILSLEHLNIASNKLDIQKTLWEKSKDLHTISWCKTPKTQWKK
jgi:hypothetical protein